jgi:leader peptidase (prepilin peptidase)/N-methyltransferase
MYPFIAFFFGLLFGSYGNSVVYRLPRKLFEEYEHEAHEALNLPAPEKDTSLTSSRSRCPHCKAQIAWYDNLPLVSWLILRSKCRHCHAPISPRYFILELSGGLLGLGAYLAFGPTLTAVAAFVATLILLWLTVIDIEHMILPDELVFTLLWLGLIISTQSYFISPTKAILGAALGYALPAGVAKCFAMLRGIEGMGGGDFKLLAALGAFAGPMGALGILFFAAFGQVFIQGGLIAAGRLKKDSPFPFGPALALFGAAAILLSHALQLALTRIGQ